MNKLERRVDKLTFAFIVGYLVLGSLIAYSHVRIDNNQVYEDCRNETISLNVAFIETDLKSPSDVSWFTNKSGEFLQFCRLSSVDECYMRSIIEVCEVKLRK